MTHPSHRRITVSEIAHLAGVGASAVSNWRNRYRDFPTPVETTPGGDFFDFSSVIAWLEIHGRAANLTSPSLDRDLWAVAEHLGRALPMEDAVLATLQLLYMHWRIRQEANQAPDVAPDFWTARGSAPERMRERLAWVAQKLAQTAPGLRQVLVLPYALSEQDLWRAGNAIEAIGSQAPDEGWGATVTAFLRRMQQALSKRAGDWATPPSITQLMIQLLSPLVDTVYDPAAGYAMFLAEAAEQSSTATRFIGQEIAETSWRIGYLHLAFQDVRFEMELGDTLRGDRYPQVRAARIGLDTPPGPRFNPPDAYFDDRWRFGAATSAEWMWAQHVVFHLDQDGIGVMTMSAGALSRTGRDAAVRKEIATEGILDAVIELPPGLTPGTAAAGALLIFDRNRTNRRDHVLFVDARQLGVARRGKVNELPPTGIERLVTTIVAWRAGEFQDEPLFAASASIGDIVQREGDISPRQYIRYTSLVDGAADSSSSARLESAVTAAREALQGIRSVEPRVTESLDAFTRSTDSQWPLVKLGELLTLLPQTGTRQEVDGRGPSIPWIPTRLVSSGTARLTALPEEQTRLSIKGRLAKRGDVLLASRGINAESKIGCATVDFDGEAAFAESLMLLRPDSARVLPDYLRLALTSTSGRLALAAATTGSVIANLRRDALEGVEIRLPDIRAQERLVAEFSEIEHSVAALASALETSSTLLDTLRDEIAAGRYSPTS